MNKPIKLKSKFVAYILLLLVGGLGLSRLYLEDYDFFWVYLALWVVSFELPYLYVITIVLVIIDLFYTNTLVDEYNLTARYNARKEDIV